MNFVTFKELYKGDYLKISYSGSEIERSLDGDCDDMIVVKWSQLPNSSYYIVFLKEGV